MVGCFLAVGLGCGRRKLLMEARKQKEKGRGQEQEVVPKSTSPRSHSFNRVLTYEINSSIICTETGGHTGPKEGSRCCCLSLPERRQCGLRKYMRGMGRILTNLPQPTPVWPSEQGTGAES